MAMGEALSFTTLDIGTKCETRLAQSSDSIKPLQFCPPLIEPTMR